MECQRNNQLSALWERQRESNLRRSVLWQSGSALIPTQGVSAGMSALLWNVSSMTFCRRNAAIKSGLGLSKSQSKFPPPCSIEASGGPCSAKHNRQT